MLILDCVFVSLTLPDEVVKWQISIAILSLNKEILEV